MKKSRIRLQAAALTFILFPAVAGVLAVHASATCERFVRTYITRPVANRVSRQTAEAWAKWGVGHPNWKPNPNLKRPKYVMTREEAMQKVDFACSVPLIPSQLDGFLQQADLDTPPAFPHGPTMTSDITIPSVTPPEVAEVTPLVPIVPTVVPQAPTLTPEPGSLLLAGTGLGCLCILLVARSRREDEKNA
jgi:hypothetical protein